MVVVSPLSREQVEALKAKEGPELAVCVRDAFYEDQ